MLLHYCLACMYYIAILGFAKHFRQNKQNKCKTYFCCIFAKALTRAQIIEYSLAHPVVKKQQ